MPHRRRATWRDRARARRLGPQALLAGPVALLATAAAVGVGVAAGESGSEDERDRLVAASSLSLGLTGLDLPGQDDEVLTRPWVDPVGAGSRDVLSRSLDRAATEAAGTAATAQDGPAGRLATVLDAAATRRAVAAADQRVWATAPLNLWTSPASSARQRGVLDEGTRVLLTGRSLRGREEVVIGGRASWVTVGYLTEDKPSTGPAAGVGGECTNGSSVPTGVSAGVVAVHRAVCARWPEITSYGTFRADGEHSQGLAIDVMVSGDLGWEVAEYVRANYAALDVEYVIYAQHIWSVDRASEGWRAMEDRGSATANHYDHVHVTTY
ncbi:hypothetical protein [Nocardioides sp. GY 10127]|uniref:hypothetical protein n=1 Tax=Nocardioides sp. GY 10127 TaxID=2569762 RepID=UPI0010A8C721|nr:hypothetical protein [Nocardioides sp. GY 10127]TIC83953.1 hypothetical protein E8D37_03825 [Nocardioides sp. GY 10127]